MKELKCAQKQLSETILSCINDLKLQITLLDSDEFDKDYFQDVLNDLEHHVCQSILDKLSEG